MYVTLYHNRQFYIHGKRFGVKTLNPFGAFLLCVEVYKKQYNSKNNCMYYTWVYSIYLWIIF